MARAYRSSPRRRSPPAVGFDQTDSRRETGLAANQRAQTARSLRVLRIIQGLVNRRGQSRGGQGTTRNGARPSPCLMDALTPEMLVGEEWDGE